MAIDRIARINEIIRREMGVALLAFSQSDPDIDPVDISFVQAETSRDLRNCMIHVSFMGDAARHPAFLSMLRRYRADFQAHLAQAVGLKYTPRLAFKQTTSIEKGDRVLSLLADLPDDTTTDDSV